MPLFVDFVSNANIWSLTQTFTLAPVFTDAPGSRTALGIVASSDTASGIIELAIQSEMETGTDVVRAVVPGRQHNHPGHPKAWGKCTQTGTMTANASYNVASVTDAGVGNTTWNIGTNFSGTAYGISVAAENGAASYDRTLVQGAAAGTFAQFGITGVNTLQDAVIYMSAFGDQ